MVEEQVQLDLSQHEMLLVGAREPRAGRASPGPCTHAFTRSHALASTIVSPGGQNGENCSILANSFYGGQLRGITLHYKLLRFLGIFKFLFSVFLVNLCLAPYC